MFPPGRYGRRRAPRRTNRLAVGLLSALVVVASVAVSVRLYLQYGRPEYTPQVVTFTPEGPDAVTVTFTVTKPGGGPAVCRVRALTRDVVEVGAADVDVPSGRRVTVSHRLATSERAYTVRVPSCHAPR